jgi:hypothetical protein
MDASGKILINRGEVIGIGKVKIPRTHDLQYEIPMFTFLVIKESEDSYISTCIHLRIDGYGKTVEEARNDMAEDIYHFLCQNFKKLSFDNAWDNIKSLYAVDDWSNELWNAYHEAQIQISIQGRSTDNVASCLEQLKRLEKRVKKLESKEARLLEGEILKIAEDLIVDYTTLGGIAA